MTCRIEQARRYCVMLLVLWFCHNEALCSYPKIVQRQITRYKSYKHKGDHDEKAGT